MTTVSARERIESCLASLQRENPRLNAVAVPLYDDARQQATALDDRRRSGEPAGPLDGTPFVVKEVFDVAGTPSTAGIKRLASTLATTDGPLVARLKAAGAILVAKANAAQLMLSMETSNPLYGRTANPCDLTRSPGGSSGGDAALIASGAVSFGLGTDIGGSIRIPAHVCGIAGLRPSRGRLTLEGSANPRLYPDPLTEFDQPGPMARTVGELTRVSRVLLDEPLIAPSLAGLRVGFYVDDGVRRVSPALRRAVQGRRTACVHRAPVSRASCLPTSVRRTRSGSAS
jgi:fatty acid amide hydrolase